MKVLVTGGSGLVGSAIKNKIGKEENFYFLSSKDCDLRERNDVKKIFESFKPNIVIHLANKVAGLYGNMNNNYQFLSENIRINMNILDFCKEYKVKRLISILSTCVFPAENITYPLSSNQILKGEPHFSNSGYSYSKRILYSGGKILAETTDLEVVNIIPTNIYGENDNYNLLNSHVVPGLIHKCYLAKINNEPLVIKGTGTAVRQFLYANDFADIIVKFISFPISSNYCESIVSPPKEEEISIKELVNKIVKIFDFTGEIIYDDNYSNGQHNKTTDSNEILSFFPDYMFTDIDEGLIRTIDHFKNNYKNLRI